MLQVRQAISAAALATKKSLGLPGGPRPGAWSTLTAEELSPKLEAAEARQRALAVQMSPVHWELEQRWACCVSWVPCLMCGPWVRPNIFEEARL